MRVALRHYSKSFCVAAFLLTLSVFANTIQAQAPNISYTTPQAYPLNSATIPLSPQNTGGVVSAALYVSTFAGHYGATPQDGFGTAAGFAQPYSCVTDAAGNIYVADFFSNQIRKITPAGDVTTLAGSGAIGSNDDIGEAASFFNPFAIAIDATGNLYVTDSGNNLVRKITQNGTVTTIAGNGSHVTSDGIGKNAGFNGPYGICVDVSGNIYVSEADNLIRKITPSGNVTKFAGNGIAGFADGQGIAASFNNPINICIDASGNIYVADGQNNRIRKITPQGMVSTFAGSGTGAYFDGQGISAMFYNPIGITIDNTGILYVFDDLNGLIRKITPAGAVTTIAGTLGETGYRDGLALNATFGTVRNLTADDFGNLYLGDALFSTIRKISSGNYSIDKTLPQGLIFDTTTGTISGTPIQTSPAADYTITASNSTGSSSTIIRIEVDAVANITTSPIMGSIVACLGLPSVSPNIQQFTVSGSNLTGNITASAPAGFEISVSSPNGPYSSSNIFLDLGGSVLSTPVYVRSTASGSTGNISGNIVLTSPGGTTQDVAVTGTVNPLPTVNQVGNQTIANDAPTTAINFAGTGNAFTWTNNTPGIGLPASGTGNISSFNAVNTGNTPITATIIVTPTSETGCSGTPITFTINVNPSQPETITFAPLPVKTYGDPDFSPGATSTNNTIPITYASDKATVATIVNDQIHITGAGTAHITASQAGNDSYMAANPMTQLLTVDKASLTLTADDKSKIFGEANPIFTFSHTSFAYNEDVSVLTTQPVLSTIATTGSAVGHYPIEISDATSPNYDIKQLAGTLTINPAPESIVVPNTFTPNGDGINDVWNIGALINYPQCLVSVYTRYGGLVFQSRGYPQPWDGTYKGAPVPTGTYYYIINPQSGQQLLSGFVAVLR
jgi:gliding motility-associated-like protein